MVFKDHFDRQLAKELGQQIRVVDPYFEVEDVSFLRKDGYG